MNTTPPPFGDPAKIDRENSAAVKKGLLFGCGGCAALVMLGAALVAGIFFLVMGVMRSDETCAQTLKAAQESKEMQQELGQPMRMGWFVTGDISTFNGNGTVNVTVPIVGPAGEASVHTMGTREPGGPWVFTRMEATILKTGRTVKLQ
ncbi:MAG: cytochrome c oxidase assembly factor Coa1 family protein [Prosthecobacter sp.]|nr:cytochrome c oxidase assembly factor Coa1 family protein [Prosthecobacter sp.]